MWDMIRTQFHFPSDSQFLWKNHPISSQTGFLPMYRSLFGGALSTAHVTWCLRHNWSVGRNELRYILHQLHNTIYITFFKATLYKQTYSLSSNFIPDDKGFQVIFPLSWWWGGIRKVSQCEERNVYAPAVFCMPYSPRMDPSPTYRC